MPVRDPDCQIVPKKRLKVHLRASPHGRVQVPHGNNPCLCGVDEHLLYLQEIQPFEETYEILECSPIY